MRTLEVRHFRKIQKWLPMVTRCAKHFNIKILRASSQIPFDRYALRAFVFVLIQLSVVNNCYLEFISNC